MPKIIIFAGLIFAWLTIPVVSIFAQEEYSLGIANYYTIKDKNVKNGNLVSSSDGGYFLSKTPYDPFVIGVVSTRPAVSLNLLEDDESNFPVVSSGNVEVTVSSINGEIKEGDYITSSTIPGVGMKAKQTGYVIGQSLGSYSSADPKSTGTISVALNLHYAFLGSNTPSNIRDILNLSLLATYESPSAVFKYVVAGIIILISFILGVLSFGRAANTGVEALGRNPLAGRMIQLGIFMNVAITISIILAGFGMAYLIIRL